MHALNRKPPNPARQHVEGWVHKPYIGLSVPLMDWMRRAPLYYEARRRERQYKIMQVEQAAMIGELPAPHRRRRWLKRYRLGNVYVSGTDARPRGGNHG